MTIRYDGLDEDYVNSDCGERKRSSNLLGKIVPTQSVNSRMVISVGWLNLGQVNRGRILRH